MDNNLNIQIEKALKVYRASGVADQVDYQKFYLYSIVTHSTAIEGSTVTEIENQLLFDEGIAAKGTFADGADNERRFERRLSLCFQDSH